MLWEPKQEGLGGAEVIWRGSTRGWGSARPSEDGRDGEGRRRRRPKQREQRGKGSEGGRNATRGQDNSEEGPPGGNPRADRLSLGAGGLCSTVLRRQNSEAARLAVYTARLAGVSDRIVSASPQAMLGEFHHPEKETSDPH